MSGCRMMILGLLLLSCHRISLPQKTYKQYSLDNSYTFAHDTLSVHLKNTLACPIRIWIIPKDTMLTDLFSKINPVTLSALSDTLLQFDAMNVTNQVIQFASRLGDIAKKINVKKIDLPFLKNRSYRFIQGYNSTPTHNTDWSRYAMDFGLSIGDSICAATDGFVVGIIEDYQFGGSGAEWRNHGNFITIYDPSSGLFTQYAHLKHKGSLVKMGDQVKSGQIIGLSGMTGQTNIEHLHFNCLQPIHSEAGMISIPMDSIGQYKISELKRNQIIHHH